MEKTNKFLIGTGKKRCLDRFYLQFNEKYGCFDTYYDLVKFVNRFENLFGEWGEPCECRKQIEEKFNPAEKERDRN